MTTRPSRSPAQVDADGRAHDAKIDGWVNNPPRMIEVEIKTWGSAIGAGSLTVISPTGRSVTRSFNDASTQGWLPTFRDMMRACTPGVACKWRISVETMRAMVSSGSTPIGGVR